MQFGHVPSPRRWAHVSDSVHELSSIVAAEL
jgi:hypothetical protein